MEKTTVTRPSECAHCGAKSGTEKPFPKCSACTAVQYCSKQCQQQAWSCGHNKACTKIQFRVVAGKALQRWETVASVGGLCTLVATCFKLCSHPNKGRVRCGSLGYGVDSNATHWEYGNPEFKTSREFQTIGTGVDAHMWHEYEGIVSDVHNTAFLQLVGTQWGVNMPHPKDAPWYVTAATYNELKQKGYHYIPLEDEKEERKLKHRMRQATIKAQSVQKLLEWKL